MGVDRNNGNRIGIGIIGAGRMGAVHAKVLRGGIPGARLIAVADSVENAAKRLAAESGVETVYADYIRLIQNREVHAVIVAVPTSHKLEIVRSACEAGKHVFCEKPVALTLQEADQLVKSTERSPVKFQVGYQRRFDPPHVEVMKAIESGELGEVVYIKSNTRDPVTDPSGWPDPRTNGGIFLDTCTHDYDTIRWLSGSEVSRVTADGSPRSVPDQHSAITNITLASGALAQVDATRMASYGYDVRVEVVGTKASAFTPRVRGGSSKILRSGWESSGSYSSYADRFVEAYRRELDSFVESIIEDKETRATARDGRAAVEIAVAARRSMVECKSINLPL